MIAGGLNDFIQAIFFLQKTTMQRDSTEQYSKSLFQSRVRKFIFKHPYTVAMNSPIT